MVRRTTCSGAITGPAQRSSSDRGGFVTARLRTGSGPRNCHLHRSRSMKKQLSYVCLGAGLALLAACSSGTQEASGAAGTPTDAAGTATPPKPDAAVTAKPGTLDATMA